MKILIRAVISGFGLALGAGEAAFRRAAGDFFAIGSLDLGYAD